ncbi:amidohydrolase family protein [Pseudonocardia aurantiaca]|uniref:Amidohydrolase family protein n=1 Tax=Pseudonocardia aurantiaca TaxID=75290 RepID=A0ABW4FHU5_9PSEU
MAIGQLTIGSPDAPPHLTGSVLRSVRRVRLLDGTVADLHVADGRIVPAGHEGPGADLDGSGWRVLPAASEPHAHLDKALTAPRTDPGAGNDLVAAIEQWRAILPTIDAADIAVRALAAVRRYVARGITTIRTHVDVPLTGDPMRGVDALVALREQLRGRVTLQVCVLAGSEAPDSAVAEAVARGVDVIGGCPHLAPDPRREVTRMLDVAERHGLPVDLHADEQTDVSLPDGSLDIVEIAEQVIARGLPQRVTASHSVRLGSLPPERLEPVLELVARAGLGIVTLPITNLYLQGRGDTHSAPRGLTAVRRILDHGIPLAAGADNLRDPFNPAGRADPFETTSLLMTAGHLRPLEALAAVTTGARAVLGISPAGTVPGDAADLVLVPDGDLGDVLAGAEDARIVVSGGRVLADTRVAHLIDLPADAPPLLPAPNSPTPSSPAFSSLAGDRLT